MNYEFFFEHQDYARSLNIYLLAEKADGSESICTKIDQKGMAFEPFEHGEQAAPMIAVQGAVVKPFLQAMADGLHKIGIRPKKEPMVENEVSAIRHHLEDMRALVFSRTPDNKIIKNGHPSSPSEDRHAFK